MKTKFSCKHFPSFSLKEGSAVGCAWQGWLLLIFILPSCLTVKKIERNCDKFAKVCVTSTETVTKYRDTTFYIDRIVKVPLPRDTVRIIDTVRVINNQCYLRLRHKTFGVVWVSAEVANSILSVRAGLIDSTILVPVKDTIYIDNAIQTTTTSNTVVVEKRHIPKFYKFTFWAVMVQLIALVGFVVFEVIGIGRIKKIFHPGPKG